MKRLPGSPEQVGDDLSAINPSMGVQGGRQRADGVLIVAVVERHADGSQRGEIDHRYADSDGGRRHAAIGGTRRSGWYRT